MSELPDRNAAAISERERWFDGLMRRSCSRPGAAILVGVALVCGATLGGLNLVFAPWTAGLYPVSGLALPLFVFSVYSSLVFLIGVVALVVEMLRERRVAVVLLVLVALMTSVIGFSIGSLIGWKLWEDRSPRWLDEAVAWCDRLRPELERYRAEHGAYPSELERVCGERPKPVLWSTRDVAYSTNDGQFEISINISRGLAFRGARFDSSNGQWIR